MIRLENRKRTWTKNCEKGAGQTNLARPDMIYTNRNRSRRTYEEW